MMLLNNFLFIALPYIAVIVFVIGTVYRYKFAGYKTTSLSSQFLEGRTLFWGSVPFHIGMLVVFSGHILAFLLPDAILMWNGHPIRLYLLELTGFVFGICVLVGLSILFFRRLTNPRVKMVTTKMDIFIEVLLLAQICLGLLTALTLRWGSSWFASDLTPYLWSIIKLNPQVDVVVTMPWAIKLHIVGAYLFVFMIPFSRLIHFMVAPFHYLWRPYQVVIWNWNQKKIRDPKSRWSHVSPKNN